PGLAAAEKAQHAALNLELVRTNWLDRRAVKLTVLGIIDLPLPRIRARLLLHVDQDRHAEREPSLLRGVRIMGVLAAGRLLPGDRAPHSAVALRDPDIRDTVGDAPVAGRVRGQRRYQCARQNESRVCYGARELGRAVQHGLTCA